MVLATLKEGNSAYTFLNMQGKKENAQLSDMIERATEKGINLVPIIDFFTTWYDPSDTTKLITDIEITYAVSFLTVKENTYENQVLKDHLIFLNFLKLVINEAQVNNLN